MVKTLGIVEICPPQSPLSPTEIPAELALRRFGDSTLLEWVARRATDCQWIDRVVVSCGNDQDKKAIQEIVPADVAVFAAGQPDPLACFAATVRQFAAEAAVRIDVNSPFIDPTLIDRLVASAQSQAGNDYASFCFSNGRPVVQARFGMFAEWCSASAITQADQAAREPSDRRISTRYLYTHPEMFQTRLLPVPEKLTREALRAGGSVSEDWDDAQAIYEALGPERLEWNCIAEILDQQTGVRKPISN